ncbi:hypothetical protein RRG08_039496 [Elysia crispata]|uniref:Uncharacterized protein n=1 Tax=Elysia crispata TaxID=231223 RepID=A0AAE0YLJ6_9GAST|nr:hypothetical protein RRG08_039496 [Elysia crispata]
MEFHACLVGFMLAHPSAHDNVGIAHSKGTLPKSEGLCLSARQAELGSQPEQRSPHGPVANEGSEKHWQPAPLIYCRRQKKKHMKGAIIMVALCVVCQLPIKIITWPERGSGPGMALCFARYLALWTRPQELARFDRWNTQ